MNIRLIQTGTADYDHMVALRMKVLLHPIGIPRSYINPQKEADDFLVAAFDEGDLVGCCILTPKGDGIVQLRQMAVDGALQKRGIGAAIVSFAESLAKEKGYTTLLLHARDNVEGFYQRCGYRVVGEQFFEVGIPHHRMEKQLVP